MCCAGSVRVGVGGKGVRMKERRERKWRENYPQWPTLFSWGLYFTVYKELEMHSVQELPRYMTIYALNETEFTLESHAKETDGVICFTCFFLSLSFLSSCHTPLL